LQEISKTSWHSLSAQKVAEILQTDPKQDLDLSEANIRLQKFGENTLSVKKESPAISFLLQFKQPLVLISAEDYNFQVFVDEKETEYDLVIHPNGPRIGLILLPNAEKVEIIGTKVIPEFGAIAGMILAVAIIEIIAISAKSRLSIISRI